MTEVDSHSEFVLMFSRFTSTISGGQSIGLNT